jgi:hypothetical protein
LIMRILSFVAALSVTVLACSTEPLPPEEDVGKTQQEILLAGYTPVAGDPEVVTVLPPGSLAENAVVLGDYAYVSTTLFSPTGPPLAQIIQVNLNDGAQNAIPVPVAPGFLMSGIDKSGTDLIFAATFLPQDPNDPTPPTSLVLSMDTSTNAFNVISQAVPAGMNGLTVREDSWYAADTLFGLIWTGSVAGGPASVWSADPLLAADPNYIPGDPCGPPIPFGVNGIRLHARYTVDAIVATNVTQHSVLTIPVNPDGSAGTPEITYQEGLPLLDDLLPDRCGRYPDTGTFLATNGSHSVLWKNGFNQELVSVLECAAPTAVVSDGGDLIVTCSSSPLVCPYDPQGYTLPTLVRVPLKAGYKLLCMTPYLH